MTAGTPGDGIPTGDGTTIGAGITTIGGRDTGAQDTGVPDIGVAPSEVPPGITTPITPATSATANRGVATIGPSAEATIDPVEETPMADLPIRAMGIVGEIPSQHPRIAGPDPRATRASPAVRDLLTAEALPLPRPDMEASAPVAA